MLTPCLMAKFSSAVLTPVRMLSTCRVSAQHFLQLQETLTAQPGFSWRLRFCEIMDVSVMWPEPIPHNPTEDILFTSCQACLLFLNSFLFFMF